jgi:hypothetical protein
MGKWFCAFGIATACAPVATPSVEVATATTPATESKLVAAYPADVRPAMRARVVCAIVDSSPKRWSDVAIMRDTNVATCEVIARAECEGRGDVTRACSPDPLPPPLVSRGWFVKRHEMPDCVRYEVFATAHECASAKAEGKPNDTEAWLEAQIAVETRELEETKTSIGKAERKLAEARAAQDPNVPLLQLEVESQRRKRDLAEKLLVSLREQRAEAATIACAPAGGS